MNENVEVDPIAAFNWWLFFEETGVVAEEGDGV